MIQVGYPEENIQKPLSAIPSPISDGKKFFTRNKIIIFSILVIIIILTFTLGLFYFLNQKNDQALNPTPNFTEIIPKIGFNRNVPDVKIANYSFQTTDPEVPSEIPIYFLKSNFTKEEVDGMARTFNLTNGIQEDNEITYSQITPQSSAIFNFNTIDGSFLYQAFTPTKVISKDPQIAAMTILKNLGFTDNLIDCGITYKRAETPTVTYVECHRSWDKMGLPLVSLPGFYNTSSEIQLSQMKPGIIDGVKSPDPAIIQVSTGQNGLSRPTDFNTATIGVMQNGSVIFVASNLRFIENVSNVSSKDIKTAAAAKAEFNDPLYSVVLPAGEGMVDLDKVFPGNKGQAKNATVSGYNLVYLEKLRGEKQTAYEPFYMIRGEATLENGYTTKLVQAVPARIKSSISQSENKGLQLDALSPIPTAQFAQPTSTPQKIAEDKCRAFSSSVSANSAKNDPNYVYYILSIPGYGKMELFAVKGAPHTLQLASYDTTGSAYTNAQDAVSKLFENTFVQTYTLFYKGNPQILPYTNMAGYYKAHPVNSNTPFGVYPSGIPDPRGIVGISRQNMLKNYEAKVLAFDRGENVTADGPGFSIQVDPESADKTRDATQDFMLFFIIDSNSLKNNCSYITGSSPSIFIRGSGNYEITPSHVVYAEPILKNNFWSIHAEEGGLFVNGKQRNFLYYEFDSEKITLKPTNQGYSFNSEMLPSVILEIAKEMQLTNAEEKQLFNEINNEIAGNSKFITLRIVSEDELNKKLPLQISPNPGGIVRVHFIIEEGNEKLNLQKPRFPVLNGENVILELGASKIK